MDEISFIRIKQILSKESYIDFSKFMSGQTTSMTGVYEHDFIRWVHKRPVID